MTKQLTFGATTHELGSVHHNSKASDSNVPHPSHHLIAPQLLGGFLEMAIQVSRGSSCSSTSGPAANGARILRSPGDGSAKSVRPSLRKAGGPWSAIHV